MQIDHKFTKVIATIGPSSSRVEVIQDMILFGVNVFRLNFSHGKHESHLENINNIRSIANKLDMPIALLADLQGPKIRVGKFKNDEVTLLTGAKTILDTKFDGLGDAGIISLDYKELVNDVKQDDILLLDDGKISLRVIDVCNMQIHCTIEQGGVLKNNKGINKLGGGLSAKALTNKDVEDIKFISKNNFDYVAISFPKDAQDIIYSREQLKLYGSNAKLIAKMERAEAVFNNMESIIKVSDGIMVARGDLAVEIGDAMVPGIQKRIIKNCRNLSKISIVATQMLESMIENSVATRAEVSDIANAVLDGSDAVMLSAETASGKYPILAVETMSRVCIEAEKMIDSKLKANFGKEKFANIQQTISMAALFSAYHQDANAIIALTTSGSTAWWMSRIISHIPIYAVTDSVDAYHAMSILRGVFPILLQHKSKDTNSLIYEACNYLLLSKVLNKNDTVVVTFGDFLSQIGQTNSLKIIVL
jgi:pyruvate kinase